VIFNLLKNFVGSLLVLPSFNLKNKTAVLHMRLKLSIDSYQTGCEL